MPTPPPHRSDIWPAAKSCKETFPLDRSGFGQIHDFRNVFDLYSKGVWGMVFRGGSPPPRARVRSGGAEVAIRSRKIGLVQECFDQWNRISLKTLRAQSFQRSKKFRMRIH